VKTSVKLLLAASVLVLLSVCASANSADPGIIIRDPVCTQPCPVITSNSFSFNAPASGFGFLHFLNGSGNNWTSLIITELAVPSTNITCSAPGAFLCTLNPFGQTGAQIILTAAAGLTGIPNGSVLEIQLQCLPQCWPGGLQFNVAANTPEPGTMILLLTGSGAIFLRRKRAKLAA
jgi:hypothetical protein